jgi:SAM-dependent methyltransferase/uncharacterized protein YbaR (Trm112 family)
MHPRVQTFVCCPHCGGSLRLNTGATDGEHVIEGSFTCAGCAAVFPIAGGIPRFVGSHVSLQAQRTVERFGRQWQEFDFITEQYEQQFLSWIAPNTPETFRDQVVLDLGCGKGRHSRLAARFGARDVLAVDLSEAVDAAYRNTRDLDNVHVIQADLFQLPIAPGAVGVSFSIGVVHHTPDPEGAFRQLARCLKPGGRLIVWVYGRENNEWLLRFVDPVRRAVTSRLPHRWLYHLSKAPAAALYVASRGIYRPLNRPAFHALWRRLFYHSYLTAIAILPFRDVHLIVHDHLVPPIASYIARDELERWFRDAGLTEITIGWHNENSWRGTAVMPASGRAALLEDREPGVAARP